MENAVNFFKLGGPMMIPIALLAFAGVLIFMERMFYLHKGQIRAVEFVSGIKTLLKKRRLLEAVTLCDETYGTIPRIVKTALLNCESTPEVMSQAVESASINEFRLLERRISSLELIARLAPLFGLIGTIVALLEIFHNMGSSGSYANASQFSMQVYNALVSSATGLIVCALAWVAYGFLMGRVKALAYDIEWSANETMLFILRKMPDDENLMIEGNSKK